MKALPSFFYPVLAGCLLNHSFAFLFPMLSVVLLAIGIAGTDAAIILALSSFFAALFQPLLGLWMDRGQGRRAILLGSVLQTIGIAGMLFSPTQFWLVTFVCASFICGISCIATVTSRIVEGGVEEKLRPQAASLLFSTVNLGFGISAILAYFFLQTGRNWLLGLDGLTYLLYALILYRVLPQLEVPHRPASEGRKRLSFPPGSARVLLGSFLIFAPTVAVFSAIPLLYTRLTDDAGKNAAITFGWNNVLIVVLGLLLAEKLDGWNLKRRLWIAGLASALGHALVPYVQTLASNVLVTTIWSVGEVFVYPVITQMIFALYPPEASGVAAGVKSLVTRGGFVFTPLIAALLMGFPVWHYSLVMGLCPLLGLLLLRGKL